MRPHPLSVLVTSSLTEQESEATLSALKLDTVDFLAKSKADIVEGMQH